MLGTVNFKIMRVVGTTSTKDNLCDYCQLCQPECPKANHIKFGDGIGNDNVIECSEFIVKSMDNNYPIIGKPELGVFKPGKEAQPAPNSKPYFPPNPPYDGHRDTGGYA